MPEEKAPQAVSDGQPKPAAGRKVSPMLIVGGVAVIGIAVFAMVLLKGRKGPEPQAVKTPPPAFLPELLDIPALEVAEIQVTVPTDHSGIQRRSLAVGVVVYFAPADGHEGAVKDVVGKLGTKVISLGPKFRSIIIKELNPREYSSLVKSEVQNTLLDEFKNKFNDELGRYGLNKLVKVDQVVWQEFNWGN